MNIFAPLTQLVVAKTCGCQTRGKRVTYAFVPDLHSLCVDEKDIMQAEIEGCQRLLKYAKSEGEQAVVEKEIHDLKMALDLIP
jgi:hypothetical protein